MELLALFIPIPPWNRTFLITSNLMSIEWGGAPIVPMLTIGSMMYLTSKSGSNYAHYTNPEFDALVEKAGAEADLNKRLDMYRWAEDILIN